MCIAVIFISIDSGSANQALAWQSALMKLLFTDITPQGMLMISRNYARGDYCNGWKGIYCENGIVNQIYYDYFRFGDFNLDALPHATTEVFLNSCRQKFQIRTRSLPRELVNLSLRNNAISGRIDLTALPSKLQAAHLRENHMTGPIDLTHLPKSLRTLDLLFNKITQETVWYDNMPENIGQISLVAKYAKKCSIGEVRAVNSSNAVDTAIFTGMKIENVH